MNKELTFAEAIEQIKSEGDLEKQNIEVAEKTAELINAVVKARVRKNMTQRELADMCGLKQSAIARMETMQVIPRVDTLVRIARCLDVSIEVETTVTEAAAVNLDVVSCSTEKPVSWTGQVAAVVRFPQFAYVGG